MLLLQIDHLMVNLDLLLIVLYEKGKYDIFKYTKTKNVNMQKPLSIRPTKEIEKKLEKLIKIEKMDKPALIRKVLNTGLNEELKKCAIELFREKKVSLAKAAEIADISVIEMIDFIRKEGVSLHITAEDIEEDYEAAMK
jgi:predicted HTH domain antitoxin